MIHQKDFASFFLNAFPYYTKMQPYSPDFDGDDHSITELFLENFCVLFGLAESKEIRYAKSNLVEKQYKQTKLFKEIFKWKV